MRSLLTVSPAALLVLISAATPACTASSEPETTGGYATQDIEASLSAQSDDHQLTVYAALVHAGGFLRLANGDTLAATVGGQSLTLDEVDDGDQIHYVASIPRPAQAVDVQLAFNRSAPMVSAPVSTVTVPAPFQVHDAPTSFKLGQPLVFPASNVSPSYLAVDVSGPCIDQNSSGSTSAKADANAITIDMSTLPLAVGSSACDIDFDLRLETHGKVDPAFSSALLSATEFAGLQHQVFHVAFRP
jgi:hypothetical protein